MISICVPSRGRLNNLNRMIESVLSTSSNPDEVEIVVFDDNDHGDNTYQDAEFPKNVKLYRTKERQILSKYWDLASQKGTGPYYMLCDDDVVFRTQDWDLRVVEAFDAYEDKIVLVNVDDGDPRSDKSCYPHPFVHQNWIDAVGYFVPHYFSGDFPDTWLDELAEGIGRKINLTDVYCEHLHPAFDKAPDDPTYAEKWKKHFDNDMPAFYLSKLDERKRDIEKLKKAIHG